MPHLARGSMACLTPATKSRVMGKLHSEQGNRQSIKRRARSLSETRQLGVRAGKIYLFAQQGREFAEWSECLHAVLISRLVFRHSLGIILTRQTEGRQAEV